MRAISGARSRNQSGQGQSFSRDTGVRSARAGVCPLVLQDMISSPNGVETTLGCCAADRAVADSPAAAVKRETVRNMACAQPSSEPADKVQCLGDMPWRCRATAVQPDRVHVGAKSRKVNCCTNADLPVRVGADSVML